MVQSLHATKFAELDPEEFYDFTSVRPMAYNEQDGQRAIRWPTNQFYYWRNPIAERDLVLFLGTEPNLKWRTYTETLLSVIEPYDLDLVVNVGSLMDATPHTREPRLSGGVNRDELKSKLGSMQIRGTGYQGPVGITSVLMDACTKANLDYISVWGHAPHYVQHSPNYKVTKALTQRLNELLNLSIETESLARKAEQFEAEVTKAIASSVEVSTYVKRLERHYDSTSSSAESESELPTPESVVEDLDEFFKGNRPEGGPFSTN